MMFVSKDETVASAAPKGAGVLRFGLSTSSKKEEGGTVRMVTNHLMGNNILNPH